MKQIRGSLHETSLQKNVTFQKVQLGYNVHIDQEGWLFQLKAWSMKNMSYF
jgi:hypothetical protein